MRQCAIMVATTVAIATALAGCGRGDDASAVASNAFVPPVTQAPDPVDGQRQTTPLTAYVGHNPRDAVDGVSFFDRTEVANALIDAVPEDKIRHMMIAANATRTPIFANGSQVGAYGCDPAKCADHNWTVFTAIDGNADNAAVCYHRTDAMGQSSRWTTRAGSARRPGACPSA